VHHQPAGADDVILLLSEYAASAADNNVDHPARFMTVVPVVL